MILKHITDVELIRPHLEKSLERVKAKTGERWSLPFVLNAIASGNAGLFRFEEKGTHVAYLVCERLCGYEVVLNLWILEGSPSGWQRDEMIGLVDGLGRSVGATHWKLESPRKGWARALRGYLTGTRTVYERAIP